MIGSRLKIFLIALCLLIASSGCASAGLCTDAQGRPACLRILFIGNSYTYVNDLPTVFAEFAVSGGHPVETGMAATGGWTLAQHASSADTFAAIRSSKWNFVVLQEQSEIPSLPQSRTQAMYPAVRSLAGQIRAAGATPMLFITWAHRDGWPENGLKSYEAMQAQIDQGYLLIAEEQNLPAAPVGQAWWTATRQNPPLDLWQADGSHPTVQGTYLAACVFYAVIFRQSPVGSTFLGDLPQEPATTVQRIAANPVLNTP